MDYTSAARIIALLLTTTTLLIVGCKARPSDATFKNNGIEVANPEMSVSVPIDINGGWCSGIIISPYPHVLTNAHCIYPNLKVRVKGQWVEPVKIDVPPEYTKKYTNEEGDVLYDFAVLTLPQGTPIPGYVKPAAVAPKVGDLVTMRGFGVTHYGGEGAGVLREGKNRIVPCLTALSHCPGCRRDWIPKEFRIDRASEHPGMVCLEGRIMEHAPEGEVSTGFGDSGSGVMNEAGELIAVAGGGTWDPVLKDIKVTIFGVVLYKGHLEFIQNVLARTSTPFESSHAGGTTTLRPIGHADGRDAADGVTLPSQCECKQDEDHCVLTLGTKKISTAPLAAGSKCETPCVALLNAPEGRTACY